MNKISSSFSSLKNSLIDYSFLKLSFFNKIEPVYNIFYNIFFYLY